MQVLLFKNYVTTISTNKVDALLKWQLKTENLRKQLEIAIIRSSYEFKFLDFLANRHNRRVFSLLRESFNISLS